MFEWIISQGRALVLSVANAVFVWPLRQLYFRGPELFQAGGWAGTDHADICAQITGVSAKSWTSDSAHKKECQELLEKKFDTFFVGLSVAAYAWALFTFFSNLIVRVLLVNPFLDVVSSRLKKRTKNEAVS